ncbi:MAG TPA: DUF6526 family protein [Granulicella sp.]|jgi:hypothetical protein|nr:DUF6526 family protein [Granulicella sp.]
MPEIQNFKNHAHMDPPFHYITAPILLVNFLLAIAATIWVATQHRPHELIIHLWILLLSFALLVLATNTRVKDLKVQDRVIRLEERLRFAALLPPATLAATSRLTVAQIVALRFASDDELPALVDRTLAQNLTPRQIKESITSWRPDHHRV